MPHTIAAVKQHLKDFGLFTESEIGLLPTSAQLSEAFQIYGNRLLQRIAESIKPIPNLSVQEAAAKVEEPFKKMQLARFCLQQAALFDSHGKSDQEVRRERLIAIYRLYATWVRPDGQTLAPTAAFPDFDLDAVRRGFSDLPQDFHPQHFVRHVQAAAPRV